MPETVKGVSSMLALFLVLGTVGWVVALVRLSRSRTWGGAPANAPRRRIWLSMEGAAARQLLAGQIDNAAYRALMAELAGGHANLIGAEDNPNLNS